MKTTFESIGTSCLCTTNLAAKAKAHHQFAHCLSILKTHSYKSLFQLTIVPPPPALNESSKIHTCMCIQSNNSSSKPLLMVKLPSSLGSTCGYNRIHHQ